MAETGARIKLYGMSTGYSKRKVAKFGGILLDPSVNVWFAVHRQAAMMAAIEREFSNRR